MRWIAVPAAALAAGCAYVDPDPGWIDRPAEIVAAAAFARPAGRPAGLDPPAAGVPIGRGDWVRFGLQFDDHGERQEWSLEVTVLDPRIAQRALPGRGVCDVLCCEVVVADGDGAEVARDRVELTTGYLQHGLARACRDALEAAVGGPGAVARPGESARRAKPRALLALRGLLAVVRRCESLHAILWRVVEKPPLWSIVTNLGVSVRQDTHFDRARRGQPLWIGDRVLDTWELPIEVRANDWPALRSTVVVTDPISPVTLCAGIVGVHAWHPSDPEVVFSMRLLGARRGPR